MSKRTLKEFYDEEFWLKNDSDAIIAYPLQGAYYSPLIEKMKQGKKKVFLKFDSDGRMAYPLERHSFRVPLKERFTARNLVKRCLVASCIRIRKTQPTCQCSGRNNQTNRTQRRRNNRKPRSPHQPQLLSGSMGQNRFN